MIGDRFLDATSDGYRLEIASMMICHKLPLLCYKKSSPRRPQDAPRHANTPQDAPRGASNSPKTRPRDPKMRPGRLPRRPQEAFRGTQDAARHTQDAPRHDKDAPISSKSRPDLVQTSILESSGDDFEGFVCIFAGSWRRIWIDFCSHFQSWFSPSFGSPIGLGGFAKRKEFPPDHFYDNKN